GVINEREPNTCRDAASSSRDSLSGSRAQILSASPWGSDQIIEVCRPGSGSSASTGPPWNHWNAVLECAFSQEKFATTAVWPQSFSTAAMPACSRTNELAPSAPATSLPL